ncbi:MAG: hypothetical protein M3328_14270, partial [Chloroflexota bacterium]|nr:hypothetical protein [Chloroflexota bacterium]
YSPVTRSGMLVSVLLFILPFLAYLYIPLQASTTWWYPNNPQGFMNLVMGGSALPLIRESLGRPLLPRLKYVFFDQAFRGPEGWALLALGAVGLALVAWEITRRRRLRASPTNPEDVQFPRSLRLAALVLCATAFAAGIAFAVLYDIIDIADYLAVPTFMWCVLAGAGILGIVRVADYLATRLVRGSVRQPVAVTLVTLGVLMLVVVTGARSLARQDVRVDYSGLDRQTYWRQVRETLQTAPAGSILIGEPPQINEAMYFQRVGGWRPDIIPRFSEDVVRDTTPVAQWLEEKRNVYLLGQFEELLSKYSAEQVGPIWRLTGAKEYTGPPPMSHEVGWRLANKITLVGYTLEPDPGSLMPGGLLNVTLYWKAEERIYERYTVFNHVVDAQGNKIGQKDDEPLHGFRPTATWQPGELIVDSMTIAISPDAEPGTYKLVTGMYNSVTQQRVPVAAPDGTALGDYEQLAEVVLTGK